MNRQARKVLMLSAILAGCTGDDQASPPPAVAATDGRAAQAAADGPATPAATDGPATPAATDRSAAPAATDGSAAPAAFAAETERFADVRILRYRVPGFAALQPRTKELLYYLYEAALSGREIIYDQKYRYNLAVKRTLEAIVEHNRGDRATAEFRALEVYLKRIWFANGIHHHYAHDKFEPGFDRAAFERFVRATPAAELPVRPGESVEALLAELAPVIFDAAVDAKLVSKSGAGDVLAESAINFYGEDVGQEAVRELYAARQRPADPTPVSLGLNSQLVSRDGELTELVWKVGGVYTEALERVVYWLERAITVAENDAQRAALEHLVQFYRSGDLADWDAYNVAWVADTNSTVDVINGFIEVYHDPLGMRGAFESVVSFRDAEATRRIEAIAREAQWFEDHSPILDRHKKDSVTGITGKVITVVVEAGDAAPATPIGINLPNADWIRARHGSKSVSLGNIVAAYDAVRGAAEREFAWDEAEIERGERYGQLVAALHTDMHEVIGHASGKLDPGVGALHETLRNYGSTLEEARADLVALYYAIDPKLVELGLLPSVEVGYLEYDRYIRNGLMQQLNRVVLGKDLEEDHMRNRQLVAGWAYEQGRASNVIERRERDGKTYFVVRDYQRLRELFGELLRELQRIKSTGDYAAIRDLVETYGVRVDRRLHEEVLDRYARLDIPPYSGFIQPRLVPVEADGRIVDVRIEYPQDFSAQMLEYAARYAHLPAWR
jgi:dipeptidyl-peptidase-3